MGTKFAPEVYDTDYLTMAFPLFTTPYGCREAAPWPHANCVPWRQGGCERITKKKTYQKYPPVIKHGNR